MDSRGSKGLKREVLAILGSSELCAAEADGGTAAEVAWLWQTGKFFWGAASMGMAIKNRECNLYLHVVEAWCGMQVTAVDMAPLGGAPSRWR